MNSTIYNYFRDNFGILEDTSTLGLFAKYNDMSKKELKSNLHQLKTSRANPLEIKYVAKHLQLNLKPTPRDENKWLHLGGRRRAKFQL